MVKKTCWGGGFEFLLLKFNNMKKHQSILFALFCFVFFGCTKSENRSVTISVKQIESINQFNKALLENSSAIGSHLKSKGLNKNDFFKIKSLGKKFQEPSGNSGISAKEEQEKGFIANNELNYTLTQAEAESLLEPLYIESVELLTDFEIYQDLVDEFQDPTISDIILSALLVTNEYSSQAISGVTEHELRHC